MRRNGRTAVVTRDLHAYCGYVVVTREMKLFRNYFSLSRRQFEILVILPEIISNYFKMLIEAHEYFPTCPMVADVILEIFAELFRSLK